MLPSGAVTPLAEASRKKRLSVLLQGKLREFANRQVKSWFDEQIKEKAKGRNHDLAVVEYKVAKEVEKYLQVKKQMENKQKKLDELQEQEYEIIRKAEIAKEVYDMVLDSHDSDFELREKMIDIMWENDKLKHEVSKLKETLDKAYGYMKQFVVDGRNMLERFKETLDVNIKKLTRDLWK